jgi:hypothetical protein
MAQANHTSGNKNNQQFPPLVSQKPSIQAVMEVVLGLQMMLRIGNYEKLAERAEIRA